LGDFLGDENFVKANGMNGPFPLLDAPIKNHGSCINHLGLDICFNAYTSHDSLQARLIEEIDHCLFGGITGHLRTDDTVEPKPPDTNGSAIF